MHRRLLGAALAALLVILSVRPVRAEGPVAAAVTEPAPVLHLTGGVLAVQFAADTPGAERSAVLAGGERLAALLEQELGPLRPAVAVGGEAGGAIVPPADGTATPALPLLGQLTWSDWPAFARSLWNLWWQEPAGPFAVMLRLPEPIESAPAAGPAGVTNPAVVADPAATDQAQILRGAADLWLEEALVRANLATIESLTAHLQQDRQVTAPDSLRLVAGRLQGLALDDRLRSRDTPLSLGRVLHYLRLDAAPTADPLTLLGNLSTALGGDVAGWTADFLQGRLPVPIDSLLETPPGRAWPTFWDRLRAQEFSSIGVLVDDRPLVMDVPPALVNGRTLVPLRAIFEALGASVNYDDATRQIAATKEGRRVILWPDDPLARVDARLLWLDTPPQIQAGRTLVPVRFVSEALGAVVEWVDATRTVLIRASSQPLEPLGPESAEGRKVAYLTFDDGPSTQHTAAILDTLDRYGVKATFFLVGKYAKTYPDLVKREFAAGHAIGNHSWDHDYKKIYASLGALLESVQQAEEAIAAVTGERPLLLRVPGGTAGNVSEASLDALQEAGYTVFDWNVSTADSSWPRPSARDIVTDVDAYTYGGKVKHAIILMHDGAGHPTTVEALPAVIAYLVEHGYLLQPLAPDSPLAK